MAHKSPVEFKGKLNGLYLNLDPDENFDVLITYLKTMLENRASFYQGSRIIGVKGRVLNYKQKAAIEMLISDEYGITVESLEDPSREEAPPQKKTPLQTPIDAEPIQVDDVVPSDTTPAYNASETSALAYSALATHEPVSKSQVPGSDTHFFFGTMRSGKSIQYPGNVVVIGDVNPGAEIVAEGNIIVMGRVLGFVHAGSAGNDRAIIIANLLKPTQIRISTFISVPPSDDETHHTNVPEKATVSDGNIKIEKCH